jgi:ABC-type nitrate/sulfonate/bicarbonate transport system substrate-binding protein
MADLVEQTGGRIIETCRQAGVKNLYPYVATKDAIANKKEALGKVLQAVADNIAWIQKHPDEQAKLLAPKLGFSQSAIKTTYARGAKGLQKIDAAFYAKEQPVIDELVNAKIVAHPVKASDVFLSSFNGDITPQGGS